MPEPVRRITTRQLRVAAKVATERGVTITIESAGRVYRISPVERTTSERDAPTNPYDAWRARRGESSA